MLAASGDAPTADPGGGADGPAIRVDLTRVDQSTLRYAARVTDFGDAEDATFAIGGDAEVVRTSGLRDLQGGEWTRLRWTGGAGTAAVVFETDAAAADRPSTAPESYATESWALGSVPPVVLRWSPAGAGATRRTWPLRDAGASVRTDDPVVLCDRYAFVGAREETTRVVDGERIRLILPAGVGTAAGRERIADSLAAAAGSLAVGDRGEEVRLFALPDPARRGGQSFASHDEGWVYADSALDHPNNVWVHEYVHTRQSFAFGERMRWFREASAEYYAARLTYQQGRVDRDVLREHLEHPRVEASLTRRGTWPNDRVPYTRGGQVLALLDRTLREATDGRRSLDDVFRRLNEHEGPVTYPVFAEAVAGVAGHGLDDWLDRHVRGDAALPPVFDGTDPAVGASPAAPDPVGTSPASTGPTAPTTGDPVPALSVGFGLFASVPLWAALSRRINSRDGVD